MTLRPQDLKANSLSVGGMTVVDNSANATFANLTITGEFVNPAENTLLADINGNIVLLLSRDPTAAALATLQTTANNIFADINSVSSETNLAAVQTAITTDLSNLQTTLTGTLSGTTLTSIHNQVSTLATSSAVATLQTTANSLATAANLATLQSAVNSLASTVNTLQTTVNTILVQVNNFS